MRVSVHSSIAIFVGPYSEKRKKKLFRPRKDILLWKFLVFKIYFGVRVRNWVRLGSG